VSLASQLLIAVVPAAAIAAAGAIYLNRRRSDRLYQRLFGMDDDPDDEGYIPQMNTRVQSIDENVRELNHERIDTIEGRLDDLQDSIETLEARLPDD